MTGQKSTCVALSGRFKANSMSFDAVVVPGSEMLQAAAAYM
jgi:hypothetical protein